MDIQGKSFFGQYGCLLKEWCCAAFCSATLDWMFSKIPIRNGIFATLLSIGQLTCSFYLTNMLLDLFGGTPQALEFLTDNWLAYNTIIIMSPTAINRLSSSYRKLHVILYGSAKIPSSPSCTSGNCGTSGTTADAKQAVEPVRERATALTDRISQQWKETNNKK